jgi:hypothetical protein
VLEDEDEDEEEEDVDAVCDGSRGGGGGGRGKSQSKKFDVAQSPPMRHPCSWRWCMSVCGARICGLVQRGKPDDDFNF